MLISCMRIVNICLDADFGIEERGGYICIYIYIYICVCVCVCVCVPILVLRREEGIYVYICRIFN
jgi:hypothetical protein